MKTLVLFSLSLAVTLGMPPLAPGVEQTPVLKDPEQSPLLGDWVPMQGRVVEEDPAPHDRPASGEQKDELAPVPVDMKQSMVEEIKVKPEGEVKTAMEKEPAVIEEPDVKEDLEADGKPEVETEPELNADPEVKVKSQAEPDVQEQFQVQMNLEAETETGEEIKERHIDMEGKYEMGPIMELVPLDDDDTELSDQEKSLRAAFQNQNPVNRVVSEKEEEGLMREMHNVLDEGPIMELEPQDDDDTELSDQEKSLRAAFQNQNPVNQPESEEEEGLKDQLDEGPIMELVPLDDDDTELSEMEKSLRAAFQNQNPVNRVVSEKEEEGLMREMHNVLDEGPIMELEPLDEDNRSEEKLSDTELSDMETSLRAAFQSQNPVNQPQSEKGEGLMSEMHNVYYAGPIMELEPEEEEEQSFLHRQVMPQAATMEDGPALDIMGQPMQSSSEYFPSEEAMMGVEHGLHQDDLLTEAGSEFRQDGS
ncbi:hypothetical protein EYF80_054803 [Liparis tanakae]|uniref:Uncharacterized protein n=1 Tax=Liparis tanakae TaxID=230148 RepID=A0A4Z2F1F6_9TELE|nr:hypothetical protein EYF80_054803 [Liparis tanakae]